jgi:Uncharacterized conserved protein (DUF2249)
MVRREERGSVVEERSGNGAGERLAALDVRATLAAGVDPLADILEAVGRLGSGGALVLTAPFRPAPLEELLGGRGWRARARRLAEGEGKDHVVEFLGEACPEPEDLTALEAPGPLARVLERAASLAGGDVAMFRVPRRPALLPVRLDPAVRLELAVAPDGITLVRLELPAKDGR